MGDRYGPTVDSYLFHLIGEEESVAAFKDKLAATAGENLATTANLGLEHLESAAELGIEGVLEEADLGEIELFDGEGLPAEPLDDTPSYELGIPVLVQVRQAKWTGADIDGFTPSSRIGDVVAGHATAAAIGGLSDDPDVFRVDVSRDAGEEELDVSVAAVHGDAVHAPPVAEKGAHALIGVIDGGLDVLHEAFHDENGRTRIVQLWDQTGTTGPAPPDDDGNPLYGTLYTAANIDQFIATGVVSAELGRDPKGHGTHVTSIAAGRAGGAFYGGLAPEARIAFVKPKLDTPAGDPRSIGYSTGHVDALAFLDRVARDLGVPISVNISLGMNAGAHDGTSTLESAFDNFTSGGRMPGRVLVKSAGNAASQGLHAAFQIGQEQVIHLQWNSKNVIRKDDVIEIWFNSSDDLAFALSAPGSGGTTALLDRNSTPPRINGSFTNGNLYSIALDRFHRDNGDTRLSLRVTRGSAPRIAPGIWTLRVEARSVPSAGLVHAWIERHRDMPVEFITQVSSDGTLSIPGTANTVISVAALDRPMQGQVMSFSSRGATRDGRPRPDIGAPGHNIEAAKSGTATGVIAMPGTSMAAPHVTGALALLMSQQQATGPNAQLNANQIRAALNQSSRGFNGHWNTARGWGMLDIEALLALFD